MTTILDELKIYGELTPGTPHNIVVLHPLADDLSTLERLGLSPIDCKTSDLYWAWQDEIVSISIECSQEKRPFVTYHRKAGIKYGHSFHVITNKCPISSFEILKVVDFLSRYWARSGNSFLRDIRPDRTLKIEETDICA